MPNHNHRHTILTTQIGFLIECHYDQKMRATNYRKLQKDWVNNIKQQKISYYFLTGNDKAKPLSTHTNSEDIKLPINKYFNRASSQTPHLLYSLVSERLSKTTIKGDFLVVDLPPYPQYRSLIWWLGYYYLIYQHCYSSNNRPKYWVHIPDHTWINLDRLNRYINKPKKTIHYVGWKSKPPDTNCLRPHSSLIFHDQYPNLDYPRPYFGDWIDGERGMILSEHLLRNYLLSEHTIYVWTDIFPDKAMSDVVRKFFDINDITQIVSAVSPRNLQPNPSWMRQCTFITNYTK